ncbi:hypothetical protein RB595_003942 [Gaeumannomyces hyphopodioides]
MLRLLRHTTPVALVAAAALAAHPAAAADCTREYLQAAADGYVAAQRAGDASLATALSATASGYTENFKRPAGQPILSRPLKVDFSRSILDTAACATYTEVVVTDPAHPYVIGSQIHWAPGASNATAAAAAAKIETLVTDAGDWLFNATGTLYYSSRESWDPIPEAQRDSRAAIRAAGDAYCDLFSDKTVRVPWGTPCQRLEGGVYVGRGLPTDSCNVGVPSGVALTNRRYVVDEVLGSVSIFLTFGGSPDNHQFRLEKGKLRFVHTITVTGRD